MNRHTPLFWMTLATLVVLLLTAPACAPKFHDYDAFVRTPRPLVTATEYRVAPPDVLTFASKFVREINGNTQMIRPDGVITLPLIGDLFVAGKTCAEIGKELEVKATEFYEGADVSVRVAQFNSKKVFVFGEVASPGPYNYNGANRVLDTLAKAQPTRLADPARITVLRPNAEGELVRRMTVNLDDMVKRGHTDLDAVLEEGDIVYVPPTPLAAVGLGIQQLLLPILPASSAVSGTANIEQNVYGTTYGRGGNTYE